MSKITKITAFFLFFVMYFCVQNSYAVESPCLVEEKGYYAYRGNSCDGFHCEYKGVVWHGSGYDSSNCSGECVPGTVQSKYEAKDCSYTSKTRKCCSTGLSSEWGEWVDGESGADCPTINNCAYNECWNGAFCESGASVYKSGASKYCESGRGWRWCKPASWSGTYSWDYYNTYSSSYTISNVSGGCLGTINATNCSLISGQGVDGLRTGNLSTFCKNNNGSFYALQTPGCYVRGTCSGYASSSSSSGRTTYTCSSGTVCFVRGNVTCTKSGGDC